MAEKNKLKNFVLTLQGLTEPKKKMVFLGVMGVCSLGMLLLAFKFTKDTFPNVSGSLSALTFPALDMGQESLGGNDGDVAFNEAGQVQGSEAPEIIEWKTYASPELGFSIDYPNGMVPSLKTTDGTLVLTITRPDNGDALNTDKIRVCPKNCFADVKDAAKSGLFSNASTITVDGATAQASFTRSGSQQIGFVYFLKSPSPKFNAVDLKNVVAGGWFGAEFADLSTVEKVINSFKFIK